MQCRKNRLSKTTLQAALTLALTMPALAFAADSAGTYTGLGAGQSRQRDTSGEKEKSGKAFVGYEFNKAFSVEAGYVDLGRHDAGVSTTRRERGPFAEALPHLPLGLFIKGGIHRLEVETQHSLLTQRKQTPIPYWAPDGALA